MALNSGFFLPLTAATTILLCSSGQAVIWNDHSNRVVLENNAMEVTLHGGLLLQVKDKQTDNTILEPQPGPIQGTVSFLPGKALDLKGCGLKTKTERSSSDTEITAPDGTRIMIRWNLEPGLGDLILRMSAKTPKPVSWIRYSLNGFDISAHPLTSVDGHGTGQVHPAPWHGSSVGAVLVTLFEGTRDGWVVEGRGPEHWHGNFYGEGHGQTATLHARRYFPIPTQTPALVELRIRTYQGHWQDAVDPHITWMEKEAGYSLLGTGHHPAWVRDIKVQSYVRVGDFDRLEELAKRVNPGQTIIGRQVAYRHHPMDHYWPDYTPTDTAKKWFQQARKLGFHVGAHFNSKGIDFRFPELIDRFRKGLREIGKDGEGHPIYEGTDTFAYCSAALKPFRDYIISQLREAIEAGVDLVYWDQSAGGGGAAVVDGVDGSMGLILLMRETLEAYPGVAVETEQFNPMCTRFASFSLSQMGTGHPLSGYIFHRFIHILPESRMIAPTKERPMDSNQSFGYFLPSAIDESWVQIAEAFLQYDLTPDSRLPRRRFIHYEEDGFGGIDPIYKIDLPPQGDRLFGYRGKDGVTAYFEKHPKRRGLVIYEPGRNPQWTGTRVSGTTTWTLPGILREWEDSVLSAYEPMAFSGDTIIGLDPAKTYTLEQGDKLPHHRFHLKAVPEDFAWWKESEWRIRHQDIGQKESFYRLAFTGNGIIQAAVPDDRYDLYLDGEPIAVDRHEKSAVMTINSTTDQPSLLLAVRQTDVELSGPCVELPWEAPSFQRSWYFGRQTLLGYPADGPVLEKENGDGFYIHVGGTGQIVGKFPDTSSIRLQGAYGMRQISLKTRGQGIIRVNGKELLNIDPGDPPYPIHSFDVDLGTFSGRHVLLEFESRGEARDSVADWFAPVIVTHP